MVRFAILAAALATAVSAAAGRSPALTLKPCVVQGVESRCGTFVVPEDRARPNGRTLRLHVVVVPAWAKPVAKDALTYLAGGPGGAATKEVGGLSQAWSALNAHRDILLVDQRGTGRSNAYTCREPTKPLTSKASLRAYTRACLTAFGGDVTQYGTRMAMDDVDAVRAALGYRQLDVVGGSYGATAAQVYLKLHPSSVRTLTLEGATALDVPILGRWAVNSQRALDHVARLCAAQPACRSAFPSWERRFAELVKAWDAHPARVRTGATMSGVELASVIHVMLLDLNTTVSIPFVVSRAAAGDYGPLNRQRGGDLGTTGLLMTWSIWCNEPWAGIDARGPWRTAFDSYAEAFVDQFRVGCAFVPKRAEQHAFWRLPSSKRVPVLVFAGGADPQDPIGNLPNIGQHFRDSRVVILPHTGHHFGVGGCVGSITTSFVDRGTTNGLDTSCIRGITVPPFTLRG